MVLSGTSGLAELIWYVSSTMRAITAMITGMGLDDGTTTVAIRIETPEEQTFDCHNP